jgi:hypothetical protein
MGAFAVDNAEFSVHRSARLIGLIALAGAVILTNRRSPVQFTLGGRPHLQQFAAEVFHLRRVHENFGIRWPVAVGIFVGMPCSVAVGRAIASVPRDLLREYIEAFERQGCHARVLERLGLPLDRQPIAGCGGCHGAQSGPGSQDDTQRFRHKLER